MAAFEEDTLSVSHYRIGHVTDSSSRGSGAEGVCQADTPMYSSSRFMRIGPRMRIGIEYSDF
jgi:hypothetical protein